MSLKGYQWLDENENVIMSYTFKDLKLDIWKDTTKEELDKFKKFLDEHECKHNHIDFHYHNVKGYLDNIEECK